MSNLVIVALPAEDDYVWNLSSEKKPHLALLFLGDASQVANLDTIVQFVEHAASQMLRFELSVSRRGTLGDDNADVLFFDSYNRWGMKGVKDFRGQLLKEPNIKTAYDSVPQQDEWQPHLTLGYPESPAKKDTRDYPGTHYVSFDRIAVWTGDYEGPEFSIPWDRELEVLAMADPVAAFLAHHGVKGMKWGVRRKNVGTPEEKVVSVDASKAKAAADKKKTSGVDALENHELKALTERMGLEQNLKRLEAQQPKSVKQQASKLITDMLVDIGKQQASSLAKKAVAKAVTK